VERICCGVEAEVRRDGGRAFGEGGGEEGVEVKKVGALVEEAAVPQGAEEGRLEGLQFGGLLRVDGSVGIGVGFCSSGGSSSGCFGLGGGEQTAETTTATVTATVTGGKGSGG